MEEVSSLLEKKKQQETSSGTIHETKVDMFGFFIQKSHIRLKKCKKSTQTPHTNWSKGFRARLPATGSTDVRSPTPNIGGYVPEYDAFETNARQGQESEGVNLKYLNDLITSP